MLLVHPNTTFKYNLPFLTMHSSSCLSLDNAVHNLVPRLDHLPRDMSANSHPAMPKSTYLSCETQDLAPSSA